MCRTGLPLGFPVLQGQPYFSRSFMYNTKYNTYITE
jgi:hypothetical protein